MERGKRRKYKVGTHGDECSREKNQSHQRNGFHRSAILLRCLGDGLRVFCNDDVIAHVALGDEAVHLDIHSSSSS